MARHQNLEDLEREITCAICQCQYTEPKVFPCCHYYCKECIRSLALVKPGVKSFPCPECRTDITLPEGSVDNLPTAFFVNRIKEVLSRLSCARGKVETACEMCCGSVAEAFCRQCAMFICAECVTQHRRMKVFAMHKVATLSELKEGRNEDMVVPKPSLQVCETHDQPMNIYCFDCSCLICRDCTIKSHNSHNHEFLKVAAPEMKKSLMKKLSPLKDTRLNLLLAGKRVQASNSSLKAHSDCLLSNIESVFSELVKNINLQKQELLKETEIKVSQKMEHLSNQEKQLSVASVVVQSVIECVLSI